MGIALGFFLESGISLVILGCVVQFVRFALRSLRPNDYPPGPTALPLIGNIHQFASPKPFLKFTEWHQTYGDIVGLKAGPENLVILNGAQAVRELFEKRGAIYSGRPFGYVPREHILYGGQHIIFMPNDSYFRQWRTAVRYTVGPSGADQAFPIQDAASTHLMQSLLRSPDQFIEHFRNWALLSPLSAICGHRGIQKDPRLIKWFFENQEDWLELLTPGLAPPVDVFPVLKYVPEFLAGWKQKARSLYKNQSSFYYMMLETAKAERARATTHGDGDKIHESLMARIIREQETAKGDDVFNDHQLAYLGGGVLDAAVDTTFSSGLSFVKALASNPEVLKRAQAEVDAVCGSDRPPNANDLARLPYIKACFLEVLRWRPAAPMTLPHLLDADDTIGGYRLSKGTVLLQNSWAITHDPSHYVEPESYSPERFLDNPWGTKQNPDAMQAQGRKPTYAFGSGRRQCPGELFAENTLLMMMAKLVWCFDVCSDKPVDVSINTGYTGGLILRSEPFEMEFRPRGSDRTKAIFETYEKTRLVID